MNNKQRLFEVMGKVNSDFNTSKPKFIIPVGISGSGKSTWINTLEGQGYAVVSPDDIRREVLGTVNDQSRGGEIFQIAYQRVADALNIGKNVIFDATNVGSSDRREMLKYLKNNVNVDFDAYAKIFDANPEVSKERIKKILRLVLIGQTYLQKQSIDNIKNLQADWVIWKLMVIK